MNETPSDSSSKLDYASVSMRLRAPRVAIIVPDLEPWQWYAGLALNRATHIWAGYGFILIPHRDGYVSPQMKRVAAAYDPDHVVCVDAPAIDLLRFDPERYPILIGKDRKTADELTAMSGTSNIRRRLSERDQQARITVSRACTPYRASKDLLEDDDEDVLDQLAMLHADTHHGALRVVSPEGRMRPQLHYVDGATRDLAVMIANRWGEAETPQAQPNDVLDSETLVSIAREALGINPSVSFGPALASSERSAWNASLSGLAYIQSMRAAGDAWLVIGDSFEDFALSLALDRIHGFSAWVPRHWFSDASPMLQLCMDIIRELQWFAQAKQKTVNVTSTTLDPSEAGRLLSAFPNPFMDASDGTWHSLVASNELPMNDGGHLALARDFDRDFPIPVHVSRRGEIIYATALPAILPETAEVLEEVSTPKWHVDLEHQSFGMPRGRGLDSGVLQSRDSVWIERVRSGRDGFSVMSGSYGFIPARSTTRMALARPRLRLPSLLTWVEQQARRSGASVVISDAGHRAQIAADLWGSRELMADDVRDFRPLLREFIGERGQRTSDRYPEHDGCMIRGEGYITFKAAMRVMYNHNHSSEAIRNVLDSWIQKRIVRRGLILKCQQCTHVQWVPLESLSNVPQCGRCSEQLPLTRSTWLAPPEEPQWYYDLHPVMRALIDTHGDVPITTGQLLQKNDKRMSILPEIDLVRDSQKTELDIIGGSPSQVVIGECKFKPTIPTRREQVKKIAGLVFAADCLYADQVLLAAGGSGTWDEALVRELGNALRAREWPDGRVIGLRLLSGLETPNPHDVAVVAP